MIERTCGNCAHWRRNNEKYMGLCQYRPPQVFFKHLDNSFHTSWPESYEHETCAEHSTAEEFEALKKGSIAMALHAAAIVTDMYASRIGPATDDEKEHP